MDTPSIPQKRCTKCGTEYPATSEYFYRRPSSKDGLQSACRICEHERGREYRERDREGSRERTRRSYQKHKDAHRIYRQRYYEEHREELRERARRDMRVYRERYPEKVRETNASSYRKYRKKRCEEAKQWRQEHPDRVYEYHHRRRAHKLASNETHTIADVRLQIRNQTDGKGKLRCWWCGKVIKGKYHIDHRIPLSRGGSDGARNIVIAHIRCNASKQDKLPHEWNGRLL